jgi:hypothetical protein
MQVELSCERNLFFHYTHEVTSSSFTHVQVSAAAACLACLHPSPLPGRYTRPAYSRLLQARSPTQHQC